MRDKSKHVITQIPLHENVREHTLETEMSNYQKESTNIEKSVEPKVS